MYFRLSGVIVGRGCTDNSDAQVIPNTTLHWATNTKLGSNSGGDESFRVHPGWPRGPRSLLYHRHWLPLGGDANHPPHQSCLWVGSVPPPPLCACRDMSWCDFYLCWYTRIRTKDSDLSAEDFVPSLGFKSYYLPLPSLMNSNLRSLTDNTQAG